MKSSEYARNIASLFSSSLNNLLPALYSSNIKRFGVFARLSRRAHRNEIMGLGMRSASLRKWVYYKGLVSFGGK